MSGYIGNVPVPAATQTRDTFTATAGQTTFATSGYTPSFLDVFLNGVHLVNGTDYTASNGSDVVLTSGAAAGDTLEVVSYSTFEVNSQTFTGTTTLTGDLQATTATFSGAVTGTDATLSGGVYLGGTGAANYLDDYEEGTYTVTLTPASTGSITLDSSFDTYSYVKVGNLVTVQGQAIVSSVSSPTGAVFISLPFAAADLTDRAGRTTVSLFAGSGTALCRDYIGQIVEGESRVTLNLGDATTPQADAAQSVQAGFFVSLSATYRTA